MNGREALKALADGKRVRVAGGTSGSYVVIGDGRIRNALGDAISPDLDIEWELVEEPATDEELIAEMERLAVEMDARGTVLTCDGRAGTYRECARMLRERRVTRC